MSTQTQNQIGQQNDSNQATTDPFSKMDAWIKSASPSKWIRLQAGESIILQFDEHKMTVVEKEFEGKLITRAQFEVITPQGEVKIFELARSWSEQIVALLKRNHRKIEVSRQGVGKDTRYMFIPV